MAVTCVRAMPAELKRATLVGICSTRVNTWKNFVATSATPSSELSLSLLDRLTKSTLAFAFLARGIGCFRSPDSPAEAFLLRKYRSTFSFVLEPWSVGISGFASALGGSPLVCTRTADMLAIGSEGMGISEGRGVSN